MQFKISIFAAALAATSVSAISADAVQADLQKVQDSLNSTVSDLQNGPDGLPLNMKVSVPDIFGTLGGLTSTFGSIADLNGASLTGGSKELNLCNTYSGVLELYNNLVNIVIGRNGLLADTPASIVAIPVAGLLQVANSAINNFLTSFIQLVPDCRQIASSDQEKLNDLFEKTISEFASKVYGKGNPGGLIEGLLGGLAVKKIKV